MGDHDVLARTEPGGEFPAIWGNQRVSSVVGGWDEAGIFVVAEWRSRDLRGRCIGGRGALFDVVEGAGCFADLEPEDEFADCICQRAHRSASDLHHGGGWYKPAAD